MSSDTSVAQYVVPFTIANRAPIPQRAAEVELDIEVALELTVVVLEEDAWDETVAVIVVVFVTEGTGGFPFREEVAVVSPTVIKSMPGT
jgi:hypothetical protein